MVIEARGHRGQQLLRCESVGVDELVRGMSYCDVKGYYCRSQRSLVHTLYGQRDLPAIGVQDTQDLEVLQLHVHVII